jgi:hypothetical protein
MSIDALAGGGPGAAVELLNCVQHRTTALAPEAAAALSAMAPRPARFPGQQEARVLGPAGCTAGDPLDLMFSDIALHLAPAPAAERSGGGSSADGPPPPPGGGPGSGGYDMHLVNTSRSCEQVVSEACLRGGFTPDKCVETNNWSPGANSSAAGGGAARPGEGGVGGSGGGGGGSGRGPTAAAAAGAVAGAVGGAALVVGGATAAARAAAARRRREESEWPSRDAALPIGAGSPAPPVDVEQWLEKNVV